MGKYRITLTGAKLPPGQQPPFALLFRVIGYEPGSEFNYCLDLNESQTRYYSDRCPIHPLPERARVFSYGLVIWAVRQIERYISIGDFPPDRRDPKPFSFDMSTWEEITQFCESRHEKECSYQVLEGRQLFCSAVIQGASAEIKDINGNRLAPTSRSNCSKCNMPDERVVCSHLIHPKVGQVGQSWATGLTLVAALCDKGADKIGDGSRCYAPGGLECWERLFEPDLPKPGRQISPYDLPTALDYLDDTWRLAFGKKQRLLKLGTVSNYASLSLPCSHIDSFKSAVSALDDTLKLMSIPDDLIPGSDRDKEEIKGDKTLNRLASCLRDKLDADAFASADSAISTLRTLSNVRNALQHSGRANELMLKLEALGVRTPPADWGAAWDQVRVMIVDALTKLRDFTPGTDRLMGEGVQVGEHASQHE